MRVKLGKFSWGFDFPRPFHCIWNKLNFFGNISLCLISSQYAIFSRLLIKTNFFSGIGLDLRMNVLEDCIIFLIWAAWALFNFYLIENKRFSVWSFTEDTSIISFQGGILSRYSEINKFKISRLIFPKVTKTL